MVFSYVWYMCFVYYLMFGMLGVCKLCWVVHVLI